MQTRDRVVSIGSGIIARVLLEGASLRASAALHLRACAVVNRGGLPLATETMIDPRLATLLSDFIRHAFPASAPLANLRKSHLV